MAEQDERLDQVINQALSWGNDSALGKRGMLDLP